MHGSFRKMIKETIHESQKCQRNWDLTKQIPEEDKKIILEAATNSPSKQNLNYFKLHVIEDRKKIEKIHKNTKGFGPIYKNFDSNKTPKSLEGTGKSHYQTGENERGFGPAISQADWYTNSQVLGQMLLAYTKHEPTQIREEQEFRYRMERTMAFDDAYSEDRAMAIGISAGYVNIVATQLGYSTGCCKCMDTEEITEILNGEFPILLMGIGIADKTRDRREHHENPDFVFPSLKSLKQIEVESHIN